MVSPDRHFDGFLMNVASLFGDSHIDGRNGFLEMSFTRTQILWAAYLIGVPKLA